MFFLEDCPMLEKCATVGMKCKGRGWQKCLFYNALETEKTREFFKVYLTKMKEK